MGFSPRLRVASLSRDALQQHVLPAFFERFHDLSDLWARSREATSRASGVSTTIRSCTPSSATSFPLRVYEVVVRIENHRIVEHYVAVSVARQQLVDGVPAADVVPAEFGRRDPGHAFDFSSTA